ncbi:4Fe-4S dicluster domain-containing protein [Heliophilum fasciatum]|uniref:4Fe-4S dicluster protein n=1 Tax=Heliophilum fasciatum TaxID=35700 RepID=A0A4V2SWK3_9FIRM|nr:4Fe-4S dicluster domain-containing protein [Heliophilum fasciatum]MCW2278653.1 ferredoxin [Heliophilum fasciatum]TCP62626.1 4Fe-4S dicluster protein [Heliophilum fasciatum]
MKELHNVNVAMRTLARELLESGTVAGVYGWKKGSRPTLTSPLYIQDAAKADRLAYDQYAVSNLSALLLDHRNNDKKRAIFVKGCDSRGVVRLLQDQQITPEQVLVIGLPCPGMVDEAGSLLTKCAECRFPNPVMADQVLGGVEVSKQPSAPTGVTAEAARKVGVGSRAGERMAQVAQLEGKTAAEKEAYWAEQHDKCIRCYACRNVCPACNCRDCIFDTEKKGWVSKAATSSANAFFAITRAMHVAGRCVDCGECERVCPMDIPIMTVNRKLQQDIEALFGPYDAGVDETVVPPLGRYQTDDPEEFL